MNPLCKKSHHKNKDKSRVHCCLQPVYVDRTVFQKVNLLFLASCQPLACQSNILYSLSSRTSLAGCLTGTKQTWQRRRESVLTPPLHHTILLMPTGVAETKLTQGRGKRAQWRPLCSFCSRIIIQKLLTTCLTGPTCLSLPHAARYWYYTCTTSRLS